MTQPAAEDGIDARPVPFVSRVRIKNYKSIASCDVRLGPLTILVGPNGSGKSNFLDALAFLSRALETTPAQAVDERAGIGGILRRVPDEAESFSISVDVTASWGPSRRPDLSATYEVEIGPPDRRRLRSLEVIREGCRVSLDNGKHWQFAAQRGLVRGDGDPDAHMEADRLYLTAASVGQLYAPVYHALYPIPVYNFELATLRQPAPESPGARLGEQGEHLGDVLAALASDGGFYRDRIDAYMGAVVPGVAGIEPYRVGAYMTVALRTAIEGIGEEVEFGPRSMSDGTIRAAAVLAALFQPAALDGRARLVGIEEPEIALHPAAAGALFDALTEASQRVQVIATSQSSDLLDREDLDPSIIRPVTMREGLTVIGEVDDASREIVRQKLYTLGELMRGNQLSPAPSDGGGSDA